MVLNDTGCFENIELDRKSSLDTIEWLCTILDFPTCLKSPIDNAMILAIVTDRGYAVRLT